MSEKTTSPYRGLDLLSAAVVLLDDRCAFCYLNPSAENLFAASTKVLAGKPFSEVVNYSHSLQKALDNALSNSWSYTGQNIEFRRSDGEVMHLNCTVSPTEAPGARLLIELWPIDQQLKATREEQIGRAHV